MTMHYGGGFRILHTSFMLLHKMRQDGFFGSEKHDSVAASNQWVPSLDATLNNRYLLLQAQLPELNDMNLIL